MFEAAVTNLSEGDYHAWLAGPMLDGEAPSSDFVVLPPPGEFARLAMNSQEMKQAADISDGGFATLQNVDQLLDGLPQGRQMHIESLDRLNIWNSWLIATVFVVMLTGEWLMRKKVGWL